MVTVLLVPFTTTGLVTASQPIGAFKLAALSRLKSIAFVGHEITTSLAFNATLKMGEASTACGVTKAHDVATRTSSAICFAGAVVELPARKLKRLSRVKSLPLVTLKVGVGGTADPKL